MSDLARRPPLDRVHSRRLEMERRGTQIDCQSSRLYQNVSVGNALTNIKTLRRSDDQCVHDCQCFQQANIAYTLGGCWRGRNGKVCGICAHPLANCFTFVIATTRPVDGGTVVSSFKTGSPVHILKDI